MGRIFCFACDCESRSSRLSVPSLSIVNCQLSIINCQLSIFNFLFHGRGLSYRHSVAPHDVHHLRAVGRTGRVDHFGGFAEVCRPHYSRGYDDELFDILAAEVIEAMHSASGDAQRLPRTNLYGNAVNCPGKDPLNTVEDLLVSVVLVGRRRQLLPKGDAKLEH